jgi:hypothetical protein
MHISKADEVARLARAYEDMVDSLEYAKQSTAFHATMAYWPQSTRQIGGGKAMLNDTDPRLAIALKEVACVYYGTLASELRARLESLGVTF